MADDIVLLAGRSYVNTGNIVADEGLINSFPKEKIYGHQGDVDAIFTPRSGRPTSLGYLVDTVTQERLIFQYNVVPGESSGAEYENLFGLGRSVPIKHYKHGKIRTLNLNIAYTATTRERDDLKRTVNFCRALAYPDYRTSGDLSKEPHPVILVQGRLYLKELWLVTDCVPEYSDSIDPVTNLPHEVNIALTLEEIGETSKSYDEMMRL